jgi:hypothetical protein
LRVIDGQLMVDARCGTIKSAVTVRGVAIRYRYSVLDYPFK